MTKAGKQCLAAKERQKAIIIRTVLIKSYMKLVEKQKELFCAKRPSRGAPAVSVLRAASRAAPDKRYGAQAEL